MIKSISIIQINKTTQNKNNILSYSMYNDFKFCSTVKKNNIYGCQYHPEKSAKDGLKIIGNFVNLA